MKEDLLRQEKIGRLCLATVEYDYINSQSGSAQLGFLANAAKYWPLLIWIYYNLVTI